MSCCSIKARSERVGKSSYSLGPEQIRATNRMGTSRIELCYVPHQPITFKMGIAAQCVKIASEINENRIVATAARKIQNINLMPGPSGYGVP